MLGPKVEPWTAVAAWSPVLLAEGQGTGSARTVRLGPKVYSVVTAHSALTG